MARGEKMGELLFEVSIPGRVGIKKNGRRHIGKGRNIPSSRYMRWEEQAKPYVMKAFFISTSAILLIASKDLRIYCKS